MTTDPLLSLYEKVFLIRSAEKRIADYYLENKIFSFVHFYVGQEGIAAGVIETLAPGDRIFGNHRSHGHYLASGGDLYRMYAEMLGKSDGCCNGRGGSMHMLDRSVGFMGSTPILGSIAPIAVGSGLQQKMDRESSITVVFVGDGAAEEGVVYESLNFASAMDLPVLFVLEDNLYSVNTPHSVRKHSTFNYESLLNGFGITYARVDGNDAYKVFEVTSGITKQIRSSSRPAMLHAQAFRQMAHSAPIFDDHLGYRNLDKLEVRQKEDVLLRIEQQLIGLGQQNDIELIQKSVLKKVDSALTKAVNGAEPVLSDLELGFRL